MKRVKNSPFLMSFLYYFMFDTHAHLNFPDYNQEREEIIKETIKSGVFMINVGTSIKESKEVISIAEKNREGVYASVGIHPHYVEEELKTKTLEEIFLELEKMTEQEKVVAVGETGLDYIDFEKKDEEEIKKIKELQKKVFETQILVSQKTKLPIILHCRKAHKDLLEIVRERYSERKERKNGVVHCFTGKRSELFQFLDFGFYIGVNGIIFKMDLEKVIKEIPLERMLLETDCPFLSPIKEVERNEPIFIKNIAEEVARIKNVEVEEVAKITTKNAKELFLLR